MLPKHTTVVFSGGGTRGLAFAGALDVLRTHGIDWGLRCPKLETVAGCSIGAMTALLICLGFSAHEIGHLVMHTEFHHLVSLDPMQMFGVVMSGSLGLDAGNVLKEWLAKQIAAKTLVDVAQAQRMTLLQLYEKTQMKLVCVATHIETRKLVDFHFESFPNVAVVDAVRASMALPPLFQPVEIQGALYADGGMVNNFPVSLFPPEDVLAFRLASTPQTLQDIRSMRLPLLGFVNYVLRVASIPGEAAIWNALPADVQTRRVVTLGCGKVSTFESDLAAVKDSLFASGKKGMQDFLAGEDVPEDKWM